MSTVIVDTGGANLASLQFAFARLDIETQVTRDHGRIAAASHVVLPGVGAADDAMCRLREHRLDECIAALQQPVLGICLGMQLLAAFSAERDTRCLAIVPGEAHALMPAPGRPVPHMGWNCVQHDGTGLFAGLPHAAWFYFVHSYALAPSEATTATAQYGQTIAAALQWRNFYGTQFHPERSAAAGARLLANFVATTAEPAATSESSVSCN